VSAQITNWKDKAKSLRVANIATVCVVALLLSPIIFMIVKGLLGMIAAVVILLVGTSMAKPFGMWLANKKLISLKTQAVRNAAETLQNELLRKEAIFKQNGDKTQLFIGNARTMIQKRTESMQKFPENRKQYEAQIKALEGSIEAKKSKYKKTKDALEVFKRVVDNAVDECEFATLAAQNAALEDEFNDPLQTMLANTAIQAAQTAMNSALAEFEVEAMNETALIAHIVPAPQLTDQSKAMGPSLIDAVPGMKETIDRKY
jgi:hypothetical protein